MTENSEPKTFGNNYDHQATLRFFRKWWKVLVIVTLVAAAVSMVASLLITPRYKSSVVFFPTNSNRLSKAITADRYSLDFMDYGIERDCEYTIQIVSSQSMENAVCKKFDLLVHYGINPKDPHKMFKLHEIYRSNINVKRTEFLGVEVSVMDVDPKFACDMANFIVENYDTLCHQIHTDRARDAFNIMDGVCSELGEEIDSLQKVSGNDASTKELITLKRDELAQMQTRRAERKVDMQEEVSYKFWLDQATPADKKAYPKRAIIVLIGTLGALMMCILVLLIMGRTEKEEEKNA